MSNSTNHDSLIFDKAVGVFHGAALGDAIGGSTEGYTPEKIKERWNGWVRGIVGPFYDDWQNAKPHSSLHKGDGHITDDTIMTHVLAEVYCEVGRHLTAFDMAEYVVPKIVSSVMWIPELEKRAAPLQRLFLAERYLALKLEWGHHDPRDAGAGNIANCGAAMYMSPVGIVNAGDPFAAYTEAVDIAGAHQLSYGREAAGLMAAAIASAATPGATLDQVFQDVLSVAKDGSKPAIESVLDTASKFTSWEEAIDSGALRAAIREYDTVGDEYRNPGLAARRPSRLHTIEEFPIALGMLQITGGDPLESILGGVNYGRDSDSIASMAGAIAGALHGSAGVPSDLVSQVSEASKWDLTTPARDLAASAQKIRANDYARAAQVQEQSKALFA